MGNSHRRLCPTPLSARWMLHCSFVIAILSRLNSCAAWSPTKASRVLFNPNSAVRSKPSLASSTTRMSAAASSDASTMKGSGKMIDSPLSPTPLIQSKPLTKLVGRPVYLKLDLLQPSGSFKDRGMSYLCSQVIAESETAEEKQKTTFVSSSGGNAGLAVATTVAVMDDPSTCVHVVVPETTKPNVVEKLSSLGAQVTIHGINWNAADTLARKMVDEGTDGKFCYVSPYDNLLLWTGHSSLVDEIVTQMDDGVTIGAVVVSVGGGGLLCGTLEGLERHFSSESSPLVVAAETDGANSFAVSFAAQKVVAIDAISSVATSLGALDVTEETLTRSNAHGNVLSSLCTDREAVEACVSLANDHKLLVEPACGAALAVAYSKRLRDEYLLPHVPEGHAVILEVCGGSGVTVELLQQWKDEYMT